tara:strand:- start:718 stop:1659 length:942 start_codon:yes stop_codon:yes gene_type:complete
MTKTAENEKVVYGTFLQDRVVSIKPVESSGKWSNLLVKGQDKMRDPFLYNKVKRSYQVPLNSQTRGGGVKVILDDQHRIKIEKYRESFPNGMTQKEFFETELGTNLNATLKTEDNFWRSDRRGRVILTKEGATLNLNRSLDMLKYLILLSNKMLVSPSYDDRILKATYEFMVVDEDKVTVKKLAEANVKADAFVKFAEITNSKASIVGFIKSLGRTIPATASLDWLKSEVLNVVEKDPKYFLEIVNHPQYKDRIFVQEATEAGAIIRKANKRYTLDNGSELGDLTDVIMYLNNPDNQEIKMRVKAKVDLKKRK